MRDSGYDIRPLNFIMRECGCIAYRVTGIAVLIVFLFALPFSEPCMGEQSLVIPQSQIDAFKQELTQSVGTGVSAVTTRRACKGIIREVQPLLEASPDASNRFELLKVLFEAQQRLLTLEPTEDNRRALFETCEKLSKAPDDCAELRLEADLLLSERELAEAEALVAERVKALEEIMEKYRGTSAEMRSLTIAALIASKLQAFDFQKEIHEKLKGRSFGADHKAIAFRRRSYSVHSLNVLFGGTYETEDGANITYPFDRIGHQYLVIFWSLNSEEIEGHEVFLSRVRAQQERFPDSFEVYSFNLDNLPDSGRSILDKAGVKCEAMRLPEGRSSSAYNAYALTDPVAIFVNAQGHVTLRTGQVVPWPRPNPARGNIPANPGPGLGKWLDDERYLAQLRSLFIGDFLVTDVSLGSRIPDLASSLKGIRACFTPAPFRYRLTQGEALANYRKAEKLCASVITKYSESPDLWRIRSCRIVSLLGMWSLARNPEYLQDAVKEAKATLAMELPDGAGVVAQFCLAKNALRSGDTDTEAILKRVVDAGSGATGAVACAAAAIVAIEGNAETLYQEYRQRFLELADENDGSLWDIISFFRDRHHDYRLFWPNPGRWGYTREQRYKVRQLISGFGGPSGTNLIMTGRFKDIAGAELAVPDVAQGEMMGIVFVELSDDRSVRDVCVKRLKKYVECFLKQDVPVLAAFLCEDVREIRSIVEGCGEGLIAAVVPGGLENPVVRRYGILSADKMPVPYLLLGVGSIAWSGSALTYAVNHTSMEDYTAGAIDINIEKVRTDRTFEPLKRGEFKKAITLLSGRLPPKKNADAWTPERLHGRALAHIGLKDWDAALEDIDDAISERHKQSRYGKRVYEGNVEMQLVKALALKHLGRIGEAEATMADVERDRAWLENARASLKYIYPPSYARTGVAVGVYDDLLKSVREGLEVEKK